MDARSLGRRLRLAELASPRRGRNIVLGAVLGGVAGLATCTVISNLANDAGTGFSTCTAKGYLLLGGGGAAVGALVGALID